MRKILAGALIAVTLSSLAFADDPPADDTPTKENFALFQLEDPVKALNIAREMRKQFDAGDADAGLLFSLALDALLHFHTKKLNSAQKAEVVGLSEGLSESAWLLRAAQAGSQGAINSICHYVEWETTPNDKHVFTWLECQELRAKYPMPAQ
jgi:hypothetical protein